MERIVVLANKYPNIVEPNVCVFIQQLIWSFADLGKECVVIAPAPINNKYRKLPYYHTETTEKGSVVKVFHPKYLSAGQSGKFLQKTRVKFTTLLYEKAVDRVLKRDKIEPVTFYSHFLCPSGVVASRMGKKYNVPAFMAHGEATYSGDMKYGNAYLKEELSRLSGVIAVSSQNKDFVVDAGIVREEIVEVFPNGYRKERFYPRNRIESRKRFSFPENAFIVGMVGSFDERKGTLRIQDACENLEDVYFACAGKGEDTPSSSKCLWAKPVNNEDLPWFYSSLDVFVLPTQNEGCCNAIVEAIACGCPIVSSDRAFNVDICDSSNSILIDPMSVDQLREAIYELMNDDVKRTQLALGSIEKSKTLVISNRAQRILDFMNKMK